MRNRNFFISIVFIFFLSLNSFFSKAYSKEDDTNAIKQTIVKIGISDFTLLNTEKSNLNDEITKKIRELLKKDKKENITFIDIEKGKNDLLLSDGIASEELKNPVDAIFTASVLILDKNVWINLRLVEVISEKIIYSKEFLIDKKDIDKSLLNITNELNIELEKYKPNIITLNQGNAEIKIKSIPSISNVKLDNKYLGQTPITFRNISNTKHTIEVWRDEKTTIDSLNIASEDQKTFNLSFDNKTYDENTFFNLNSLDKEEYNFEIISQTKGRKFITDISTLPTNIDVIVDKKLVGISPVQVNLSEGKHSITLAVNKMQLFRKIVDSSQNQLDTEEFNLYKLGRIIISSTPDKAQILIDKEKVGYTPKSIDIATGLHKLELVKDSHKTEVYKIDLGEGQTIRLNPDLQILENFDTNIAVIPTALVNDTLNISPYFMGLGQYKTSKNPKGEYAYSYGIEANYGFKDLLKLGKWFDFGIQFGAFANKFLTMKENLLDAYGFATKVQFVKQTPTIPVSLALGAYYNLNNTAKNNFTGYLSASRDFGDFVISAGFQTRAINLNLNYDKFYHFKLSVNTLINFNLFTSETSESLGPMFGVNVGYSL